MKDKKEGMFVFGEDDTSKDDLISYPAIKVSPAYQGMIFDPTKHEHPDAAYGIILKDGTKYDGMDTTARTHCFAIVVMGGFQVYKFKRGVQLEVIEVLKEEIEYARPLDPHEFTEEYVMINDATMHHLYLADLYNAWAPEMLLRNGVPAMYFKPSPKEE